MTKEKILEALSNVQEPDLGKDLVTLNMVKDIEIKGSESSVLFWIKSPGAGNFILDAKAKNVLSPISFDVQVIAD